MDRRTHPRIEVNQPARLTLLSGASATFDVRIVDAHERGMRVYTSAPLPLHQPVKVEYGDLLVLGDVCHCGEAGPGGPFTHSVGLMIHEVLAGLADLRPLLEALQKEESRLPREMAR
ncbi:MAG: hypothetical protein FJW30_24895 [Acidobacteria bacterium]|nr:hypothetical protein [Acidobacteriota bacterium]